MTNDSVPELETVNSNPNASQHPYIKKAAHIIMQLLLILGPLFLDVSFQRDTIPAMLCFLLNQQISFFFLLPWLYLVWCFYVIHCITNFILFLVHLHDKKIESSFDRPDDTAVRPHKILTSIKTISLAVFLLMIVFVIPTYISYKKKGEELPLQTSEPYLLMTESGYTRDNIVPDFLDSFASHSPSIKKSIRDRNTVSHHKSLLCNYWSLNEHIQDGLHQCTLYQDVYQLSNSSLVSIMLPALMGCSRRTKEMSEYQELSYHDLDRVCINEKKDEMFVTSGNFIYKIGWSSYDKEADTLPVNEICDAIIQRLANYE